MQIENKIHGGICPLNAPYIFTFVQCLHNAVWMTGCPFLCMDTRKRTTFHAKMDQDFSMLSWHPKLHSERSRSTGKESILELILKTPVRHNSAWFLQWLRPVVVCSCCLSSKRLLALKSLEPSRKWAWKVPSTSNLTTNKEKSFFAVIRQIVSHTSHLFGQNQESKKDCKCKDKPEDSAANWSRACRKTAP